MSNTINIEAKRACGPVWHYLAVSVVAAAVVFWNLGGATLDDHEAKLALSARAMADPNPQPWMTLGDEPYTIPPMTRFNQWMVPVENGQPRLVKTPLPYWLAAGVADVYVALGGSEPRVNEWTARAPSAVCAVLLVCVTLALGRRMFSTRAALLGALMLATSVGFQKWGRHARPEMLLCLMMTVSMACFYLGLEARSRAARAGWMIAFWLAMGVGNLSKEFVPMLLAWPLVAYLFWRQSTKAPQILTPRCMLGGFLLTSLAGLVLHVVITGVFGVSGKGAYVAMALCLGLPMLWYMIASRGWRQIAPLLPTALPGFVIMLAMFVPWMWYMAQLFPGLAGGVFAHQVTDRASGTLWEVQSPLYYVGPLLTFSLPWIAFLPGAMAAPFMKRFASDAKGLVYLLLWCAGIILLFTAAAGKRDHYILPMAPAMCLLMGYIAEDVFFKHQWIKPHLAKALGVAYGVVGLVLPLLVVAAWALGANATLWLSPDQIAGHAKVDGLRAIVRYAADNAANWPLMIKFISIASIPMIIAGVLSARKSFACVVALLAVGYAALYVGNYHYGAQWDDRAPIAQYAREAARMIPADQPVYHNGDAQSKTVFYFGRHIPTLQWPFMREHLREKGYSVAQDPKWIAWINNQTNAPWVMSYIESTDNLAKYGYQPVLQKTAKQSDGTYVFTLFHRE